MIVIRLDEQKTLDGTISRLLLAYVDGDPENGSGAGFTLVLPPEKVTEIVAAMQAEAQA